MKKNIIRRALFAFSLFHLFTLSAFAQSTFWLGADISWATEFESKGKKVYNYNGEERETTALMKEMGLNAVRLRVWVDPKDHGNWCNKEDVLVKAKRAAALGMEVMIDFHYSDWWADPAKQNIPAAWASHKYKQMLKDVANHTTEVLKLLKDNGVTPKWVQVGNETSNGFLWPVGKAKENPQQYAGLFKAGYDASKAVFPEAQVIVHLDNGFDDDLYRWNLDALKEGGAKWDLIGMSIYPYWAKDSGKEPSAARLFADMRKNIRAVVKRYGTDVIVTETGFEVDEKEPWKMEMGRLHLQQLIDICRNETEGHCQGVFYWEPTADPRHYKLGAFTADGHPTAIMRAFTIEAMKSNEGKSSTLKPSLPYDRPLIKMETTDGDIIVELYNETPNHRDAYLKFTENHKLDSLLFHRVIPKFMIQCGDPTSRDAEPTHAENPAPQLGNYDVPGDDGQIHEIDAEFRPQFFHKRGAMAAARESDDSNPEKKSSASQFYIVWGDWPAPAKKGVQEPLPYYKEDYSYGTPWLDGNYTVFGEVVMGLDVVDKIQRRSRDSYDRPLKDVRLLHFTKLAN